MKVQADKGRNNHLFEGQNFAVSEVWRSARAKHEHYLTEAEVARSLGTRTWRAVLATSLRQLADHLEPPQAFGVPITFEGHVSSDLNAPQGGTS